MTEAWRNHYDGGQPEMTLANVIRHNLPDTGEWWNLVIRARHLEDGTIEIASWHTERKTPGEEQ